MPQKDKLYHERNFVIAAFAYCANQLGWKVCIAKDENQTEEFENVIYIETPKGQVSWHLRKGELIWFPFAEKTNESIWDGHSDSTKYMRLFLLMYTGIYDTNLSPGQASS